MIRIALPWIALAALIGALAWAVDFHPEPPADFTFVNSAEVKSLDPAQITGQIEGRIADALFEGLTSWDSKTLAPTPGVAERWDISPDKLQYTFHLRHDAKWSDGTPVTAYDFAWAHRRLLDPQTASEYSYQLWYVKNARKYNAGEVAVGDRVEVELNARPPNLPGARGKVLKGRLIRVEPPFPKTPPADGDSPIPHTFTVEIDGRSQIFKPGNGSENYRQVLLDFDEVGIQALDEFTYRLTLENPTAYFLDLTGMFPLYPSQPRCVETFGYPDWTKPQNIVSNGPFRLEEHQIRERIRMVKSDTYWNRANVHLNTVDALAVESSTTALNIYLTGKADWIPTPPPTILPELLAEKRDDFHPTPYFAIEFYRCNVTRPPLDKLNVRKALALAIDKRQIVNGATRAGEVPARSIVPPEIRKYMNYEPALSADYNPQEARRLLAEAGYPGGQGFPKLPLLYNNSDTAKKTAELVQQQWKQTLGIDVDLQNQEWPSFLASQQNLDYSISRSGWIGDYVDPNTFLDMFLTGGANNETGWSDPKYDELVHAAARERDPGRRLKQLHDAEAILMEQMPVIPVYVSVTKNMVRPYIGGFYENVLDTHPLGRMSVDVDARRRFLESQGRR